MEGLGELGMHSVEAAIGVTRVSVDMEVVHMCKELSNSRRSPLDPGALFKTLGIVNETGCDCSHLALTHTDALSIAESMTRMQTGD